MEKQTQKENVVAGILGAILFSLIGAILYFYLYQFGRVAYALGLLVAILAINGYQIFAKNKSIRGIIISAIIAILIVLLAWYLAFSYSLLDVAKEWYENGEIDFLPTYVDCLSTTPEYLKDAEVGPSLIIEIAATLFFTIIGTVIISIKKIRNIKGREQIPTESVSNPDDSITNDIVNAETNANDSVALRSAITDDKIKVFVEADAFGHHIIFRKVGKKTEELVIDNLVYAEHKMGAISTSYSMSATISGHNFTVGMFRENYIEVDDTIIATSVRWI